MSERYLANENFPLGIAASLRSKGNDVTHAGESLAGQPDPIILQTAVAQDRVLLTFDHDFGELVFRQQEPPAPGIVLFRLHQLQPLPVAGGTRKLFDAKPALRGFFTVVSPGQYRQTALPGSPG